MTPTSSDCPWWRAWWHGRLRQVDRITVWPALKAAATRLCPHDEEEALLGALLAWATFLQEPGQEHWHCACADHEPPVY